MAKAKSNVQTALAKRQPAGALAPWQQELAEEAKADAAKFAQGTARISFKDGHVNVDGKDCGTSIVVMISEAIHGKAYYTDPFKRDNSATPVCYAFHPDEPAKMVPHEACPDKQHDSCTGCEHNRFGTSINQDGSEGNGKRCKDEVRIMCAVGETDPDSILAAEWRMASVPPTSLKNWSNYLKKLRDMGKTFRAVLTQIDLKPGKKAPFEVHFTATEDLKEGQYMALKSTRDSARNDMMQPYPVLQTDEKKPERKAKAVKGQGRR